jgi:hypothetical protein
VHLAADGTETVFTLGDTGEVFRADAKSGEDALKAFKAWLKAR